MTIAEKHRKFREMLDGPNMIIAPGAHDAFSARIVERVGFKAVYTGGNALMASLLGLPDRGVATGSEMINRARQVASAINIPYICDADTGYGDINNVWHTVRGFEEAGVSAIHIEDQRMPKRCGAMDGVTLESAETMVEKIKIALNARQDPNFVIIARTDAASANMPVKEVVRRLKLYGDAGADVLMPTSVKSKEDNVKIMEGLRGYKVLGDMCEMSKEVIYSDKEFHEMGFKIVTHPLTSAFMMSKALTDLYTHYMETGTTMDYWDNMYRREAYEDILGIDEYINRIKLLQ